MSRREVYQIDTVAVEPAVVKVDADGYDCASSMSSRLKMNDYCCFCYIFACAHANDYDCDDCDDNDY